MVRPKVVVDTSIFTNPAAHADLGGSTRHALVTVLTHAATSVDLYMTPGCVNELRTFVDLDAVDPALMVHLRVKSPDRDTIRLSGTVVHELVCEFRERGGKAIKHGLGIVREAYKQSPEYRDPGRPGRDPVASLVARHREGARHHLRDGFIDSGEDMDTLLLAHQLGARLVSADNGMIKWGHRLGIETMSHKLLTKLE
jgi:RNA ligase partner protein